MATYVRGTSGGSHREVSEEQGDAGCIMRDEPPPLMLYDDVRCMKGLKSQENPSILYVLHSIHSYGD